MQRSEPDRVRLGHALGYNSFELRVILEFDLDAGDVKVFLFCPAHRQREQLPAA